MRTGWMKVGVCVLSKSHSHLGFFSYCFEEKETRSSSLTAVLAMPPEPQRTWAARSPPRAPRSPAEAHPASPTQLPASREQVDAPGSPRTRSRANLPHRAASAASPAAEGDAVVARPRACQPSTQSQPRAATPHRRFGFYSPKSPCGSCRRSPHSCVRSRLTRTCPSQTPLTAASSRSGAGVFSSRIQSLVGRWNASSITSK